MSNLIGNYNKIAKNTVIYSIFMGYITLLNPIQVCAESNDSSYISLTDRVILETKNVDSTSFVSGLSDPVQKILVSPWFEGKLPEKFGIIVDGAWTKSAGYYSSTLFTTDPVSSEKLHSQYGHILQYFLYIYRLCGKTALIEKLMSSPSSKSGVELMDEVLKGMNSPSPVCKSFHESFVHFSIARFKQDIADEDYVYRTGAESVIREKPIDLPPYSSEAYHLNPTQKTCPKNEFNWGSSICIRVREK